MDIDIELEDARWSELDFEAVATKSISATLVYIGLEVGSMEVSVLACDDARIANLNAEFREKPTPTNVLSWPSEERAPEAPGQRPALPPLSESPFGLELGDIAIAYETCAREAADQGKTLTAHACHLIVHATLHLLGYDHIRDQDATLMEQLEREILGKLGYDDPYRVNATRESLRDANLER